MRNQDLAEVLEQQAATSAILDVISDSPGDLESVFNMIARSAKQLCHARFCGVFRFDGKLIRLVAHYGISPSELKIYRQEFPRTLGPETAIGRAILSGGVVRISDVKKDREYGSPLIRTMNLRSVAAAPMLCNGKPIGGIVVVRSVAEPFLDRQIELLKTFSANASIAVENTRLFQEIQASNRELSETLSYQVATSEVLRLIASQSVFDMIARNAKELCQGQFSGVFQYDGKFIHLVGHYGLTPKRVEKYQKAPPSLSNKKTAIGRAIVGRKIVHIPDVNADPDYSPFALALTGNIRCIVAVPMLREESPVGVIVVWRSIAEPFTEKQIELLKTFANLAMLAIEDVRLFREAKALSRQSSRARVILSRSKPRQLFCILTWRPLRVLWRICHRYRSYRCLTSISPLLLSQLTGTGVWSISFKGMLC
jgi:GAF domain-containing protein